VGEPAEDYPLPWAIYRWIDGAPWSADSVDDELAAADALAAFVLALQAVSTAGAPAARAGYQGSAVRHRDGAVRAALENARGTVDTRAVAEAWETTLAAPDWHGDPVWVHGDLLAPNLLVREGALHAVIDFGCACVGDPAVDVAAAWSLFGPKARERFRDALRPDDATWARARGWALTGIQGVAYYAESNPAFAEDCRHRVEAALGDR
jgi:aminoglycoside phosphotransferase (APT) family kinase protein